MSAKQRIGPPILGWHIDHSIHPSQIGRGALTYSECIDIVQDPRRVRVKCHLCEFWIPLSQADGSFLDDAVECHDGYECVRRMRMNK